MALCLNCASETLRKYGERQIAPVSCKECGQRPAYWWGPNFTPGPGKILR